MRSRDKKLAEHLDLNQMSMPTTDAVRIDHIHCHVTHGTINYWSCDNINGWFSWISKCCAQRFVHSNLKFHGSRDSYYYQFGPRVRCIEKLYKLRSEKRDEYLGVLCMFCRKFFHCSPELFLLIAARIHSSFRLLFFFLFELLVNSVYTAYDRNHIRTNPSIFKPQNKVFICGLSQK